MQTEEKDIQELVKQAQQGDSAAFGKIYDIFAKQIHNFLFSRVRHQQLAEDLVQTVFLKTWNNLASYKPRPNAKFSTWLFQIANYTLIDHWRTRKTTVELEKVDNLLAFSQQPEMFETYKYLWSAISQLPDKYQTVLELRFKQDLSVEETAEVMSKSEVGIRVLQHRALKALKEKLGKQ
jgi:RNA polymerase sigma-70 factor, ECF subfamily